MNVIWAQNFASQYNGGIFLAGPTLRAGISKCVECRGSGITSPKFPMEIKPVHYYSLTPCAHCKGTGVAKMTSWRLRAIEIMKKSGYQGELFVPEPEDCGPFSSSLSDHSQQILWERTMLRTATVIAFWIPRDLDNLPGFTTNIEFGEWASSGKCVLGFPSKAPKMGYIEYLANEKKIPVSHSLKGTMRLAKERYDETNNHCS